MFVVMEVVINDGEHIVTIRRHPEMRRNRGHFDCQRFVQSIEQKGGEVSELKDNSPTPFDNFEADDTITLRFTLPEGVSLEDCLPVDGKADCDMRILVQEIKITRREINLHPS